MVVFSPKKYISKKKMVKQMFYQIINEVDTCFVFQIETRKIYKISLLGTSKFKL